MGDTSRFLETHRMPMLNSPFGRGDVPKSFVETALQAFHWCKAPVIPEFKKEAFPHSVTSKEPNELRICYAPSQRP